jgi:proteic killer suppression protein
LAGHDATRYTGCVIRTFRSRETEKIWHGEVSKRLSREVQQIARRKLRMLNNAQDLTDLRVPPGNRLEALKGDRKGQHSIRINQRWRICFEWHEADAHAVEIVDYH